MTQMRQIGLLLLAGILLILPASCRKEAPQAAAGPPPVPVVLGKSAAEPVPIEVTAVGSAVAYQTVEVKSQVAGTLLQAHFREGQDVAAGALLFTIDPRPYQEALRQAESALARDQALLKQAEANLARDAAQEKNAILEARRYGELYRAGIVSQSQDEQVQTNADVYRQSVEATRAAIASARAAVQADLAAIDKAKLDLSYSTIRAPLSGRTGRLMVHPGNLVRANADTPLVVILQVRPVFVDFAVPQHHLSAIRTQAAKRPLAVRASLKDELQGAAAGGSPPAQGRVTLIDNAVDETTGTIRLRAQFENRNAEFWPGQFVNVILTLDTIPSAVVVPSEAVQSSQQGQFVYVVKGDQTVEIRPVVVGPAFQDKLVIEKGVAAGETVVTEGHLRLFPGARIQEVAPTRPGA